MSNEGDLFENTELAYIVDEAMKWNCATEWDICEKVQYLTSEDRNRLQRFGTTIRERGDYPRVLARLDNVAANKLDDAQKVYFLFGLLDELGVEFDDVAER